MASRLRPPLSDDVSHTERIAYCYASRMAQVVTRLEDELVADLDGLVADGVVASRSEGVRMGLERLVEEHRRRRIGAEIVAGYVRQPQTDEEIAGAKRALRAAIDEEPW